MPAESNRFDVVISGGSFAGLTLALALNQALKAELSIAVIDRSLPAPATPERDVRCSALSQASKRLLDAIGVWPSIADDAEPVTGIEITDSSLEAGVRPVLLTYDNTTADNEPATYIVPNGTLTAALQTAARHAASSITLLEHAEASGFSPSDAGASVTLADGRILECALVVAADGRHSPLRESAGIKVVGWDYPQTGIVTRVRHERPHEGRAVQHFLPSGPFAILPLRGNKSCITWTESADAARRILTLDETGFLAEIERRFGGKLGRLALDGPRQSWPLGMHLARHYVGDRFALVGDAAHGVHPLAGQGLNIALRDVAALAEVVAEVMRLGFDPGNGEALSRYEKWRRFDSAISAATFDGLNRLFANDAGLVRSSRELGLSLVDRIPVLKSFFVAEAAGLNGELPRLLRGEAV
jgi:2-octaprenyl-6-methoxyphenol hydroxylase